MPASEWQRTHKDHLNAYRREYRKLHCAEMNAKRRKHRQERQDEVNEVKRQWYANRPSFSVETDKKYRETHREAILIKDNRYRKNNRESLRSRANGTRFKNRLELVSSHGGHCVICGYDTNIKALEFHHTNPAEKIEKSVKSQSEADKCVLLCNRCHRVHHNGGLQYMERSKEQLLIRRLEAAFLEAKISAIMGAIAYGEALGLRGRMDITVKRGEAETEARAALEEIKTGDGDMTIDEMQDKIIQGLDLCHEEIKRIIEGDPKSLISVDQEPKNAENLQKSACNPSKSPVYLTAEQEAKR